MGKTNKAQRTKGNARPSNSSHSAQLLSLSGKTINGFIGFDGLEKDKASYVPVTGQQVSESCDSCVDSDFRMVMRKMLKRDAVTRLKAVQEFSDYCDEKDVDAVKNVLPFWPRLFNKLALDTDRRIREATHQANGKIISKVKRDIAPYLKSIMGVWLLGQCDLYAPAASAAQATFSNTFPTTKQSDAIAHCRSEIFNYFKDNLFEQTAKTLSDPSFTSSEDMENKYILVISGTLQALKLLLTIIQSRDHINLKDDFYSIVAENKFWKFAKSKEALVRGSWFALISSLAQTMHDVFNEMENKLTTTVLGSLSESDPIVAPSVWEAVLSIVVNFENCWQSININKLVLPQLWSLLKDGGKGNAQILFPCLLPFMSKLPSSIIEDEKFLLRFFSSLKESLFLDSVKLSHMECDAILTAFMECLQYICCVRLNKIDVCCSLLEKVLLNEVIPMVESSLYSRDTHLAVSKFYPLLGSLIHKLENECSARKDACEAFSKVIILFWNNLLPVTCNVFSLKGQKKIEATLYLSYFYNSMIVPSDVLIKSEKSKVKFEDEESQTDKQCQDYSVISKAINFSSLSLSNKKTLSFTYIVKFSQCLCENITEEFDLYYLNLLTEVLGSAQTGEIFKELIITMCTVESEKEQLTEFLKQFILKWIEQVGKDISKLNSIVELVFIICSYFSENEALSILNLCCEVKNCALLQCLLCKGLKKHSNIMRDWLKNPVFASNLVIDIQEIMKKVIHDTSTEANDCNILLNILDTCFTAKVTEKPIINNKNLEAILDALKCFAEEIFTLDIENSNVQGGLNFLCDVSICILKNSKVCWNFRTMDDFISLIFNQSLRSNYLFQYLSKVWITALKSYISIKAEIIHDNSIILKMATKLHSAILSSITIDESTHVLNHCFGLLSAVQESLILQKAKLQYSALFALYKLMDTILPTDKNWLDLKEGLTLGTASLFLKKQLFYPLLIDETFHTNENKIQKLSVVCYTVSRIIIQELYRANTLADKTFFEAYIVKHLPQILWLASLCEGNCAASMLPEKLSVAIIEQDCVKILSFLSNGLSEIISDIYDSLCFSCTDWALPFRLFLQFCNLIHPQSISDLIKEMVEKMNQTETMNKYMLHQIVIPHLSEEKQLFYLKTSLLEISQMRDLSNEDYAGKLAEICCYLQNNNIFMTRDMQDIIIEAIIKVIEYEFEDENLEFTYNIQITAILSSMLKYGISAFTQNILNYCMDTLKNYLKAGYLVELKNPKSSLELYEMSTIFTILSHLKSYQDSSNSKSNLELPVFDDKFYKQMIFLYIYIANTINQFKPLPEMCSNVLSSISEAMEFLPSESLVKTIDECHELPGINTNSVFQSLISSLTFGVRQIQFISHFLLLKIMKHLPDSLQNIQKLQTDDDKDDDIGKIPLCLTPMVNLLTFLTEIVESMLSDFKIGDLCVVLPETDAYIYTMAYLLSWIEMLEFISSSPSQVRSIYAAHLEETALMSQLFSNVFRLMPCNPMLCLKKGLNVDTPKKEDLKLLFITPPIFNSDSPSPEEIQSVASYVFATSLRKVPASIRTWWNNLDRKSSDIVNKFTTKYISGLLCIEEIQAVHESEKQFENMVVQARPGSREVIATYTIDDCAIELGVQLPINYPLGPISAERRGKIVIGEMEWRHWLKQLTTVLRYQNGSILDGLNIWKRNLDKKFEGVEECMICYYILHSSTLKLPKLSCRICKKKFHSACLYKWFETSYNSTCPLCRNEFCIPM